MRHFEGSQTMPLLRSIKVRQPIPDPVLRDPANNQAEESDCLVREERDGGTDGPTDLTCLRDWMICRQPFLFGLQRHEFREAQTRSRCLTAMEVTSGTYTRSHVLQTCTYQPFSKAQVPDGIPAWSTIPSRPGILTFKLLKMFIARSEYGKLLQFHVQSNVY